MAAQADGGSGSACRSAQMAAAGPPRKHLPRSRCRPPLRLAAAAVAGARAAGAAKEAREVRHAQRARGERLERALLAGRGEGHALSLRAPSSALLLRMQIHARDKLQACLGCLPTWRSRGTRRQSFRRSGGRRCLRGAAGARTVGPRARAVRAAVRAQWRAANTRLPAPPLRRKARAQHRPAPSGLRALTLAMTSGGGVLAQ